MKHQSQTERGCRTRVNLRKPSTGNLRPHKQPLGTKLSKVFHGSGSRSLGVENRKSICYQAHIWGLISFKEAIGLVPGGGGKMLIQIKRKMSCFCISLWVSWLHRRLLLALRRWLSWGLPTSLTAVPWPQFGGEPEQAVNSSLPLPVLPVHMHLHRFSPHTSPLAHPLNQPTSIV